MSAQATGHRAIIFRGKFPPRVSDLRVELPASRSASTLMGIVRFAVDAPASLTNSVVVQDNLTLHSVTSKSVPIAIAIAIRLHRPSPTQRAQARQPKAKEAKAKEAKQSKALRAYRQESKGDSAHKLQQRNAAGSHGVRGCLSWLASRDVVSRRRSVVAAGSLTMAGFEEVNVN